MASVFKRTWTKRGPTGNKVKCFGWGYTLRVGGTQERKYSAAWPTQDHALAELTKRQAEIAAGRIERPAEVTLGELVPRYLKYKTDQGKRSMREDTRILNVKIVPFFGAALRVRQLTAEKIAGYEELRLGQVSAYTVCNELAILRHMLTLARKWGIVAVVPEIEPPKKPKGRTRYLELDEIGRLLDACAASRNPNLYAIVVLALNTGMRKAEILGLEWARVDLSTSRITLYETKSGDPRGVPINDPVYAALTALEPDQAHRVGRVFRRVDGSAWGQVRTAFQGALTRAAIKGFRVPRPPPHLRELACHARPQPEGSAGAPGPRRPEDDRPVCPPVPGPPPHGRRGARGNHAVSDFNPWFSPKC